MNSSQTFIIVGAGLAGLTLAKNLLDQKQKVILFDNQENHSSLIAAGLINPLVFRRMTKSWRLDEFTDELISFYTQLEEKTNSQFLNPIIIRRLFSSDEEKESWFKRENQAEFTAYMEACTEADLNYQNCINTYGSAKVKNAFWVNTTEFLKQLKDQIAESALIYNESFKYNLLDTAQKKYQSIAYDEIVFCEGYMNIYNPWFKEIPIQTTKGETLTITSSNLPTEESLNRKCFVLPVEKNVFRIGATYVWDTKDLDLTEEGKNTLLEHLKVLTDEPIQIVQQQAGIRPTVLDRRPVIGTHFAEKNIHLFNGLGTKGYMMAPLLAKEMAAFLLKMGTIHPECRIERFYKKQQKPGY
jgi:glycine oxidase